MRRRNVIARVSTVILAVCLLPAIRGAAFAQPLDGEPPLDDPAAHALYDRMIETMRSARTLRWTSDYRWDSDGTELAHAVYRIWLAKPNFARVEARMAGAEEVAGILIGDGERFWTWWPAGKPRYTWEEKGKYAEEYAKHRMTFYMSKPTPVGMHSIGHDVGKLGAGICMTILDPSTFHGYTDSMQPYLDGVRGLGTEKVGEEECDLIEVSLMNRQRSWWLWLSKKDHLPRKLKETVRVGSEIHTEESWSEIVIDGEIPADLFHWAPGEEWKEWSIPPIEEGLLKAGESAPDFDLAKLGGGRVKLSDYRGKSVWLFKWRCG